MFLHTIEIREHGFLISVPTHQLPADHRSSDVSFPPLLTVHMTAALTPLLHTTLSSECVRARQIVQESSDLNISEAAGARRLTASLDVIQIQEISEGLGI